MENPWLLRLPTDAPRVVPSDGSIIKAFNTHYARTKFVIQTQLLPEPFIGDRNARVYLLNLNPGYQPEDERWHADADFQTAIIDNLHHKSAEFPFYYFDPRFEEVPGSQWWAEHARWLIERIGIKKLARNLFCVELFPYHSEKYQRVPKKVLSAGLRPSGGGELPPDGLVHSSAYGIYLVRRAIHENRPIVAMRAFQGWCAQLPELRVYPKLFRLKNWQRAFLSPGNIEEYDRLVRELNAAP